MGSAAATHRRARLTNHDGRCLCPGRRSIGVSGAGRPASYGAGPSHSGTVWLRPRRFCRDIGSGANSAPGRAHQPNRQPQDLKPLRAGFGTARGSPRRLWHRLRPLRVRSGRLTIPKVALSRSSEYPTPPAPKHRCAARRSTPSSAGSEHWVGPGREVAGRTSATRWPGLDPAFVEACAGELGEEASPASDRALVSCFRGVVADRQPEPEGRAGPTQCSQNHLRPPEVVI